MADFVGRFLDGVVGYFAPYWPFFSRLVDVRVMAGAVALAGVVTGVRAARGWWWRRRLVAVPLRFARGLDVADVEAFAGVLASATRRSPVVWEVRADRAGLSHWLYAPAARIAEITGHLTATLPGTRTGDAEPVRVELPGAVRGDGPGGPAGWAYRVRAAVELRLTSMRRGLGADRAATATAALLAALHPLNGGERVCVQWVLSGARGVLPPPARRTAGSSSAAALGGALGGADADERREVRAKNAAPVLRAAGRVTARAKHRARARHLVSRAVTAVATMDAPGACVVRRWSIVPPRWPRAARRAGKRSRPVLWWPMLLNAAELPGVLGVPTGDTNAPGLALGTARQLPPPAVMTSNRAVPGALTIATSNYPGLSGFPLRLAAEDRLRHVYVIGPTGVGKSTLLANMIVADIAAGYGVIVIDPKGDLVAEVAARIPAERCGDVIIWDASATDRPIGFNPLRVGPVGTGAGGEQARELLTDQIVHAMADLWRSSWGPRTSDVLRNCVLTLTGTRPAAGGCFTLAEVPELLTNTPFRRWVTAHTSAHAVAGFWASYEAMSDRQRAEVIGPALNKLRALTTRTALRLALGQSEGIDLGDVFTRRSVVLVDLAKGKLGTETAHLLGSLIVSGLWTKTLQRTSVPAEKRRPVFAYLDEFQDITRLSEDLGDVLAQARGLGLGMNLAHQFMDQLSPELRAAVFGTIRTQIAFQIESDDDARILAKRFAPAFTADDLKGQPAWEIVMRPCVNRQTLAPVTGRTQPLPDPLRDPVELAEQSRERYGMAREHVETEIAARINPPAETRPVGDQEISLDEQLPRQVSGEVSGDFSGQFSGHVTWGQGEGWK